MKIGIRFFNENAKIVSFGFCRKIENTTTWIEIGRFFNKNTKIVPFGFCRKK
jgi:hypothetical protein